MITDADVEKLKKVFSTKDDLVTALKPIKKSLKKIENKIDLTIRTFDRDIHYHHERLTNIEVKIGIVPPSRDVQIN